MTSEKTKNRNKSDYKTLMHSFEIQILEKFVFTQSTIGLKMKLKS